MVSFRNLIEEQAFSLSYFVRIYIVGNGLCQVGSCRVEEKKILIDKLCQVNLSTEQINKPSITIRSIHKGVDMFTIRLPVYKLIILDHTRVDPFRFE